MKINSVIAKILIILGSITILITVGIIVSLNSKLPAVAVLKDVKLQVPLRIYSYDKKLIAEFGDKRCTPITLDQMPLKLINAIIATEDHRFFQHPGVDLRGLMRAAMSLMLTGVKDQGGSTITMQVARNFFLTRKKTYLRKINEILLALKIEKELTKNEILELYLNKIYFGKHAYGIAAAAEVYYGVRVDQLSLAQIAMLAGLPQAPSTINPINSPQAAFKRRTHVLDNMLALGYISKEQYTQANSEPIETIYHGKTIELHAPYIAEMVRQELVERFGEDIYDKGYEIITTIDSNAQIAANYALNRALLEYDQRHNNNNNIVNNEEEDDESNSEVASTLTNKDSSKYPEIEGALVALQPDSGAILSLVGGFDFNKSSFNRAIQAERQPGSNFKPFIYGAALENGFTTATVINDAPIVQEGSQFVDEWRPQNYTKKFYGPTSLRTGIIKSRNLVSIRLLQELGIDKAVDFIEKCGFVAQKLPKTLSLALGTNLVTPLELAAGFSVFSNGGYKINPYFIDSIFDYQGNMLFKVSSSKIPAIKPQTAYLVTTMLQDAITKGTGKKAMQLGRKDLAGKTGTTNDHMDSWYTGYNRDLVVTTWVGFDEPKSIKEYAVKTALPMWIYFMEKVLHGKPESSLLQPSGLVTVKIDPKTGLLARPDQKDSIYEIFTQETVPTEVAPSIATDNLDNASGLENIF